MSEQDTPTAGDESTAASTTPPAAATEVDPPGAEALGDAGKKALDAMKADRNTARAEAQQLKAELDALRAQVEGREAEHQAAQEAQRVKDEALSAANQRILKAELRAAAKGRVNDDVLADLPLLMDLSAIEVGADGEVDGDALAAAISDLIERKPSLAAQGSRFQGGADGGARKGSPTADIDDAIAAATAAGNHHIAIALKQQRAALAANKS